MQSFPLVTLVSSEETIETKYPQGDLESCEPGLLPSSNKLIPTFAVPVWHDDYAVHLCRRIERNPRDLFAHTQRVLMHFGKNNADHCYSALVDLFIALGDKGYELRSSLMQKVCELISPEQFQFLKQRLRKGVSADEYIPAAPYSCLSSGLMASMTLVRLVDEDGEELDLLTVAQLRVEQGKREDACRILEEVLERDPGNAEVCQLLLSLYKEDALSHNFYATYYRFAGRHLGQPQAWRNLDRHFQAMSNSNK